MVPSATVSADVCDDALSADPVAGYQHDKAAGSHVARSQEGGPRQSGDVSR